MSALPEVQQGIRFCASLCVSGPRSLLWMELRDDCSVDQVRSAGCLDSPEWSPGGSVYSAVGVFGQLGPLRVQ